MGYRRISNWSTWDRFKDKFSVVESGCWEWKNCNYAKDYPRFRMHDGRLVKAYQAVLEIMQGERYAKGMEPDHTCENRKCVNPFHLEVVPKAVNAQRHALRHPKTACQAGHVYTEENTYSYKGRQICKICRLRYKKVYNEALKYKKD